MLVIAWSLVSLGLVGGTAALATTNALASTCGAAPTTHVGKIAGLQIPHSSSPIVQVNCAAKTASSVNTEPPYYIYSGSPPFTTGGGPVMGTTTAVTITPIYWVPSGYNFDSTYTGITSKFIADIAHDSGSTNNVFSVLTQYSDGSLHPFLDQFTAGPAITDTTVFPSHTVSTGCAVDGGAVFSDQSTDSACVTDSQIQAELATVLTGRGLLSDLNHLYIVFLPKGVESCFYDGRNVSQGGTCNVGGTNSSGFCGYHSYGGSTIYAALPYALVDGPTGDTCSSDGGSFLDTSPVGNQAPNGNFDADTEVSVMSHEISESITDPYPGGSPSSWTDAVHSEVGDDCAYIYGDSLNYRGTSGAEYNQTINGDHYFIQEEFSQNEFQNVNSNYSCALNSQQTVLYDPNGGTGQMTPQTAAVGTALSLAPNAFTDPGKVFIDWNSTSTGSGGTAFNEGENVTIKSSASLFAQWALFKVTFSANGGIGSMNWVDANSPANLPVDTFSRTGYSFVDWNTSPNGSGVSYPNAATYSTPGNVTLYAQWKPLAPLPPTKVVAKADVDSASITWSAPALPVGLSVTGYRVYVSLNSGAAAKQLYPGGVAVTGTSFKALHLRGGRTYYAHVIAIDSGGSSVASNYARVTISPASTSTSLKISKTKVSHTRAHLVVFSVHVMTNGSPDVPQGSVHVMSGSVTLCTIAISARSKGSCSTHHALAKGRHLIVAKFASSRSNRLSTSKSVALTIS